MDTIRHLYRIGHGPSSSHTMAPRFAAEKFFAQFPDAAHYQVTLYGSLAATGKGHFTDQAIYDVLPRQRTIIEWRPDIIPSFHPNGMEFSAYDAEKNPIHQWMVYSVGGGALSEGILDNEVNYCYPHRNLTAILDYLKHTGKSFWEYVEECEGEDIWDYLRDVLHVMYAAIDRGIEKEGVIPGGLGVIRKASLYYRKSKMMNDSYAGNPLLTSYALAVSEENATGGEIVTAPTCGSSGVVPAVIRFVAEMLNRNEEAILRALATAGIFGNVVKHNGSISGAEVGCQGEIGVACSMAAAAAVQLYSGSIRQIEYAAEMALEHNLGMTCDPVNGMVQVPCIERNAFAAGIAHYVAQFVSFSDGSHRVSFDDVVDVMKHTGQDIPSLYRETSQGGLAKVYRMPKKIRNLKQIK
ncbi:MAG: serine dehydratase [Flexilinea flocculi]|jgi:L-serine dehydratase|nr:serine dehydratase [Flexilinea flocculi]